MEKKSESPPNATAHFILHSKTRSWIYLERANWRHETRVYRFSDALRDAASMIASVAMSKVELLSCCQRVREFIYRQKLSSDSTTLPPTSLRNAYEMLLTTEVVRKSWPTAFTLAKT